MKNPRPVPLPQELVDAIIDNYVQNTSKNNELASPTLKACSLVSRTWSNRARFHLFRVIRLTEHNHALFLSSLKDAFSLLQRRPSVVAVVRSAGSQSRLVPFTAFLRKLILVEGRDCDGVWLMTKCCPLKEIDRYMQLTQVRLETLKFEELTIFDADIHRDTHCRIDRQSGMSSRRFLHFFGSDLHPQDCDVPSENWSAASYVQGRAIRSVKKLAIVCPRVSSFQDFQIFVCAFPVLQVFDVYVDFWFSILGGTTKPDYYSGTTMWTVRGLLPRSVQSIRIDMIQDDVMFYWVLRHFLEPAEPPYNPQRRDAAAVGVAHHVGSRHFTTLKKLEVSTLGNDVKLLLRQVEAQYGSEPEVIDVQCAADEADSDSDRLFLYDLLQHAFQ